MDQLMVQVDAPRILDILKLCVSFLLLIEPVPDHKLALGVDAALQLDVTGGSVGFVDVFGLGHFAVNFRQFLHELLEV